MAMCTGNMAPTTETENKNVEAERERESGWPPSWQQSNNG